LSVKAEAFSGLRSLIEDLLAPRVSQLDVKVEFLGARCEELSDDLRESREAHKALLAYLNEQLLAINSRISRLEGRSDGMKSELTAVLQMEILKAAQRFQPLPPSKTESLLASHDALSE
jgi:hypothetical protein